MEQFANQQVRNFDPFRATLPQQLTAYPHLRNYFFHKFNNYNKKGFYSKFSHFINYGLKDELWSIFLFTISISFK